MNYPKHPTDFYIAHRVFAGVAFPKGPVWGSLTDGPEYLEDVVEQIIDGMCYYELSDHVAPSLDTVRVWHFQDDVPPRDVTEDVLHMVVTLVAERAGER